MVQAFRKAGFHGLLLDRRFWSLAGGAEVLRVGGVGGKASRRNAECKQHEVAH